MRILYLLNKKPDANGDIGKHVLQLSSRVIEHGHDAAFFYPVIYDELETPALSTADNGPARAYELARTRSGDFRAPGADARELNALFNSALADFAPDVIHVHHLQDLPIGALPCSISSGARVVASLHDYGLFCMRNNATRRDGDTCTDSNGGKNCGLYCATVDRGSRRGMFSMLVSKSPATEYICNVIRARRMAMGRLTTVIAPSQAMIDRYVAEGFSESNMLLVAPPSAAESCDGADAPDDAAKYLDAIESVYSK